MWEASMNVKDGDSVEALIADCERTKARVMQLESVLKTILAEPHGCPMCDSGKLRSRKPHWDACGFGQARKALGE